MTRRGTWLLPAAALLFMTGIADAGVDVTPKTAPPGRVAAAGEHGDAVLGRRLALQWCTGCHAVEGAAKASDAAPPLQTIMGKGKADEQRLRSWLHDPHPPMQAMTLSRQQIEDVVAYLRSIAAE